MNQVDATSTGKGIIPSIIFGLDRDEFVKQIDVNIRIKRVIINRCASEVDIFEFSEFSKSD